MITIGVNKLQSDNSGQIIIEKTYDELYSMKNTGDLVVGQKYLLTDFQSIYDQPDYDIIGNPKIYVETKLGYVEPIILEAVTREAFSPVAKSTVYVRDIIHYDIDFVETEGMNTPAKGRIIKRIDERNNECYFDSRAVLFKRYETFEGSGIFEEHYDNGYAAIEVPAFDELSVNNLITKTNNFDIYNEPFLLPNIVLYESKSVKITAVYAVSCTLYNCRDSVFKYEFANSLMRQIDKSEFDMVSKTKLGFSWNAKVNGLYDSDINFLNDVSIGYISAILANNIMNVMSVGEGMLYEVDLRNANIIQGNATKVLFHNDSDTNTTVMAYYNEENILVTGNLTD